MAQQIDHSASGKDNVAALVNQIAVYSVPQDQYTISSVVSIDNVAAPIDTRIGLTPSGEELVGNTSIDYKRLTLANNRPTAGNRVFTDNTMNHASIKAKILSQLRLVGDQIAFTEPRRAPGGGESLPYVLNPVVNSPIYRTDQAPFTVTAINREPYVPASPGNYLNLVDNIEGKPVYAALGDPMQYLVSGNTEEDVLVAMLNALCNTTSYVLKKGDLVFSNVRAGTVQAQQGNTLIDFEPTPQAPWSEPGTLLVRRTNISKWYGVPLEIRTAPFEETADLFFEWSKIPRENIVVGLVNAALGHRTIYYVVNDTDATLILQPDNSYLVLTDA